VALGVLVYREILLAEKSAACVLCDTLDGSESDSYRHSYSLDVTIRMIHSLRIMSVFEATERLHLYRALGAVPNDHS